MLDTEEERDEDEREAVNADEGIFKRRDRIGFPVMITFFPGKCFEQNFSKKFSKNVLSAIPYFLCGQKFCQAPTAKKVWQKKEAREGEDLEA